MINLRHLKVCPGVMLMFFESGLFFDFSKARHIGPKACAVSLVGFVLPLVMGMLLTIIYGNRKMLSLQVPLNHTYGARATSTRFP